VRRAAVVFVAIAAVFALGCSAGQRAWPGPLYVEQHSSDPQGESFAQAFEGDRLIVDVESRTGIGHATFRPGRGVWPDRLSFRLHLRGLEGFEARGVKEFRTSVKEKPLLDPPVVDVPKDVYEGAESLDIRWVDFYR